MEKVLNQEEIDAMFRAARGSERTVAATSKKKIVKCDFRQAGQITSEQVRSISGLHEVFARNLTHWLAAYLRTAFECNLVSVEQIPYREVLARIPELAYLATFRLSPLDSISALQLDLALAFPIIDMLLGGLGREQTSLRDLTEIEEQVLEGVVRIICRELQSAWQPLGQEFLFDRRQQSAQMQRLLAPGDMTLSLSFEIRMQDTHGTLNLIFSSIASSALFRKLAREWTYRTPHGSDDARKKLGAALLDSSFSVELGLPNLSIPVQELLSLRPGALLPLRHAVSTPASLIVDGFEVLQADPVRQGQRKAGKVTSITGAVKSSLKETR